MQALTLSLSSSTSPALLRRNNQHFLSLKSPHHRLLHLTPTSNDSLQLFNPLRVSVEIGSKKLLMEKRMKRGLGIVCYASPFTSSSLQWVCTISSVVLMFASGTAIQKSILVPFFALQAPARIVSWMKGEYGIWTAFLALLVRLFFYIPGELELPFIALLMIIISPYQVLSLRRKQEGILLSLVLAGYLAFQHFTRAGSLRRAFDQGSIIATLGIACIVATPCLLLI